MIAILLAYGYQANVNCNAHVVVLNKRKMDDKIFYNLLYINRGKCVYVRVKGGGKKKTNIQIKKISETRIEGTWCGCYVECGNTRRVDVGWDGMGWHVCM